VRKIKKKLSSFFKNVFLLRAEYNEGNQSEAEEGISIESLEGKEWKHRITGVDGNTMLFGVNIFQYKWRSLGKCVRVVGSQDGREYNFYVYSVQIKKQEYVFAAGEFSNCVWGFYTPEE